MSTRTSHRRLHHRAMRRIEARNRNLEQRCPRCAHSVESFECFSTCKLGVKLPTQLREGGGRR